MKISYTFELNDIYKPVICFLSLFYFMIGSYNPEFLGFNLSNFVLFFIVTLLFVFPCKRITFLKSPIMFLGFYYLFSFAFLDLINITNSISVFLKILIPIMSMCIFCVMFRMEKDIAILSRILLYTNIITCIIGVFNFYVLEDYGYTMMIDGVFIPRMRGAFLQPNVFSMYIILTLPFMYWELHGKRVYDKRNIVQSIFFYIILLSNIFCLYMSKSRWSAVCLVIASICMFYIDGKINKKIKLVIGIITALLITTTFISLSNNPQLFYRGSNNLRIESILIACSLISDNLLLGNGIGNSFVVYSSLGYILDSTYLNILIDSGLVGMLLFAAIEVLAITYLMKKIKTNRELYPVLFMSIILITGCFLENIFYNSLINSFFGIMWYYGFKVSRE